MCSNDGLWAKHYGEPTVKVSQGESPSCGPAIMSGFPNRETLKRWFALMVSECPLAVATLAHGPPLFRVDSVEFLPVHLPTLPLKQDM